MNYKGTCLGILDELIAESKDSNLNELDDDTFDPSFYMKPGSPQKLPPLDLDSDEVSCSSSFGDATSYTMEPKIRDDSCSGLKES